GGRNVCYPGTRWQSYEPKHSEDLPVQQHTTRIAIRLSTLPLQAFQRSGADYLIAIGGGSPQDTCKAIGIIQRNPEFADVRSLEVCDKGEKISCLE
ncbi:iron-containing alcohol dehydrogenase, partial [Klebsiella pneumoniae]|uniref:iron-containing alcohol dehydrogenase n=1 Tax=Klebsiella pneumoniae TaxID=573 RepID=UPI00210CF870